MALAPHLIHFLEYSGYLGMPTVQRRLVLGAFTFDPGTPLFPSHDIQSRAPESGP